jgi:hypothetical protein
MRTWLVTCVLLCASLRGTCDGISGPDRSTLQNFSWGSFYFELSKVKAYQFESSLDGFRFTSDQGEVTMRGSEANGCRLTWGPETLSINSHNGDLEIRLRDKVWGLRSVNGNVTLTSASPADTVVFDRQANTFTIRGSKGKVEAVTEFNDLRVTSPLGTTMVTREYNKIIFAGPPLDRVPYVGRGIFIPFHGIGVFVDLARRFPMPELATWVEWKPILE